MEKTATVKIRLHYLPEVDTLDLWIENPEEEHASEPLNDNITLKLDKNNRIIGLEIISLKNTKPQDLEKLPENIRKILQATLTNLTLKTRKLLETK